MSGWSFGAKGRPNLFSLLDWIGRVQRTHGPFALCGSVGLALQGGILPRETHDIDILFLRKKDWESFAAAILCCDVGRGEELTSVGPTKVDLPGYGRFEYLHVAGVFQAIAVCAFVYIEGKAQIRIMHKKEIAPLAFVVQDKGQILAWKQMFDRPKDRADLSGII